MTWSGKEARNTADTQFGAAEPGNTVTPCVKDEPQWIEIELLGEDGAPIPGASYQIELTDGSTIEGKLDDHGRAYIGDIAKPGNCIITFPELDKDAWGEL